MKVGLRTSPYTVSSWYTHPQLQVVFWFVCFSGFESKCQTFWSNLSSLCTQFIQGAVHVSMTIVLYTFIFK